MGRKQQNGKAEAARVRLELDAPAAREVFVAGTFNAWKPNTTRMARDGGGRWVADLAVPAGRHEYKFVVDGRWCCEVGPDGPTERAADGVPNDQGTMNLVLKAAP